MPSDSKTTDDEFLTICGFKPSDFRDAGHRSFVLSILASQRAATERLDFIATALNLWRAGLGPKPADVIVCNDHHHGT